MTDFEKRVTFHPAFDRCAHEPSKNYGIHGVEARWVLIGPKGATQFLLFTNWMLPDGNCPIGLQHNASIAQMDRGTLRNPMPADLGYHAPEARYEGQEAMECDVLPAGRCFYDGSGLRAEGVYKTLLFEGGDGVWKTLESEYRALFEAEA